MKNLRKVLCIVLVIAMAFSLTAFASAAVNYDDYTDKGDIKNVEAAKVLTAIGVLQGVGGKYNPLLDITRAEAAKIICYLMVGTNVADRLAGRPSSFADVATSHWANPFIEFCVDKGVISGYGNGNFGPNDKVTASQMAKMLLVVIGYGAQGEYIGASWEFNAIADGTKRGILTTNVDYSAPATRDQVAQYSFNALTKPLVTFSDLLKEYMDTTSVFSGVKNATLGLETFGLKPVEGTDAFGYGSHIWYLGNKAITESFVSDSIIKSFTSSKLTNKGYMFNQGAWNTSVELWINGYRCDAVADVAGTEATLGYQDFATTVFAVKGGTVIPHLGGTDAAPTDALLPGAWVTLVDTFGPDGFDGKIDKIVISYEYLAKVTKVNATAGTLDATFYVGAATSPITGIVAEGFAVGDYILVTPLNNDPNAASAAQPIQVVKATTLTSKVASYTGTSTDPNTVKIGDTAYSFSATATKPSALDFKSDIVFYFDSHNNIIRYEGVATAGASGLDYLYVTDAAHDASAFGRYSKVAVTYTDGKTELLNLPIGLDAGENKMWINNAYTTISSVANGWYSYTKNADGTVNLIAANTTFTSALDDGSTIGTTAGSSKITVGAGDGYSPANSYATSATEIITVYGGTVSKTTGYAGYTTNTALITAEDSSPAVQVLVIYSATPAGSASNYIAKIYVIGGAITSTTYGIILDYGSTDGSGITHMVSTAAHPDGEPITKTSGSVVPGDVVNIGGSSWGAATGTDVAGLSAATDNFFVDGANDDYQYADSCVFFDKTNNTSGVKPVVGDDITYFMSGTKVAAVVITDHA